MNRFCTHDAFTSDGLSVPLVGGRVGHMIAITSCELSEQVAEITCKCSLSSAYFEIFDAYTRRSGMQLLLLAKNYALALKSWQMTDICVFYRPQPHLDVG